MSLQPKQTQIIPNTEPVIHWGVHFVHENVMSVYGPGEEAKAAAEETVRQWADTAYPAVLKCQTILPWVTEINAKVVLVESIRAAATDPRGVVILREWLVNALLDEQPTRKTGLAKQVPLIKMMRKASGIAPALILLDNWLKEHGYEKN